MKAVTQKTHTLRKASAESILTASPEAIYRLMENDVPKKDILIVARVAAVEAAKKTSAIIPYCHPIPLDGVEVQYRVRRDHIRITVRVETIWKTGVEMEALTAASAAALTIYDMLKPIDQDMEIVSTRLISKQGGKSQFREQVSETFKAAVVVTSDSTARGTRDDKSGKIIRQHLENFGIRPEYIILPDDKDAIVELLGRLCSEDVSLILTTGGTGLGPRDVTVEATEALGGREIPGIMEAARSHGQARTPYAMLSRGRAVQVGATVIVNLPGSSKGTQESLDAIFPAVLHGFPMMQGAAH